MPKPVRHYWDKGQSSPSERGDCSDHPETDQGAVPMAEEDIAIVRIAPETSFKNKAYAGLKEAILNVDIYPTPDPVILDDRALSHPLGVSPTPIREAIA